MKKNNIRMMEKIDVVISVGTKDCFVVKKTIKYIFENIKSNNIYIITDYRNKIFFSHKFLKKYNVSILDENTLVNELTLSNIKRIMQDHFGDKVKIYGWYFQQFLKMGFSLSKYAKKEYLIWDADTIPLRNLSFKENGKNVFTIKTEYHKPYFETLNKILGLEKTVDFSYIAEHMLIEVSIMQEIISEINKKNIRGNIWFEKIINSVNKSDANGFSEFETYGTYCQTKYSQKYITKKLITYREAGEKYGRFFSEKILNELKKEYDTVSFEFNHNPYFPKNIPHLLNKVFFKLLMRFRNFENHFK